MQLCRLFPPPPGMLGAASLGLVLEEVAESVLELPPAVSVVDVSGVDSGARGCSRWEGVPITDAGAGAEGAGGAEVDPPAFGRDELDEVPALVEVPALDEVPVCD